jgi:hypothetical protein
VCGSLVRHRAETRSWVKRRGKPKLGDAENIYWTEMRRRLT